MVWKLRNIGEFQNRDNADAAADETLREGA